MSSTTRKAHKSNKKLKAYIPELRQQFYNVEQFKDHKPHIANEEFFRNMKSSKVRTLSMHRVGLMGCAIKVTYFGYINVKGEQTTPDSVYMYEVPTLSVWVDIRKAILNGSSIGTTLGRHLTNMREIERNGEIIKEYPFKYSKFNNETQSWEVGKQWKS